MLPVSLCSQTRFLSRHARGVSQNVRHQKPSQLGNLGTCWGGLLQYILHLRAAVGDRHLSRESIRNSCLHPSHPPSVQKSTVSLGVLHSTSETLLHHQDRH